MNKTEKYELIKPEQNDLYNVEDFNNNADAIDAALMSHDSILTNIMGYIGYTPTDIYGVEVDYENNKITRLAGAVGLNAGSDFDTIAPWHRRRCNMTHDGVVTAYYGDESYTETGKLTQEVTDVQTLTTYPVGTPVNVMVEQPPFYYKFVPIELQPLGNGKYAITKARYYISPTYKDGFELHPVFAGAELPVYFAAYESCLYNTSTGLYEDVMNEGDSVELTENRIASVSGAGVIMSNRTFTNSNGATDDAGDGLGHLKTLIKYDKYSIQTEEALAATQLLFIIEYASFDSKNLIGYGQTLREGTGATAALGNGTGSTESGDVTYRGEENLWGHKWFATETLAASNMNNGEPSAYVKKYLFTPLASNRSQEAETRGLSHGSTTSDDNASITAKGIGFYDVASECSEIEGSVVGDILKRTQELMIGFSHMLHGGVRTSDETAANGLFTLYSTNNSTAFTARLFYSSRNESTAESTNRDEEMAEM